MVIFILSLVLVVVAVVVLVSRGMPHSYGSSWRVCHSLPSLLTLVVTIRCLLLRAAGGVFVGAISAVATVGLYLYALLCQGFVSAFRYTSVCSGPSV